MKIGKKEICEANPVFVIAEIGTNHGGDFSAAKKMVEEAAKAGASAVKFQLFSAEKLVAEKAETFSDKLGESQLPLYKKLELSNKEYQELKQLSDSLGVGFFASAWDKENADFLESAGTDAFKVGSGDLTYVQLLRHLAKKQKPIIISTGLANLKEVEEAAKAIEAEGNSQIVLLHCVANYPSKIEDSNLRAIATMKEKFSYPIGISDHTIGINVSLAAVALGACVVEKHFTIDKTKPDCFGQNHSMSIDPTDLKNLVEGCEEVRKALGKSEKKPTESEKKVLNQIRRGLFAATDIEKGKAIEENDIAVLRPFSGIEPKDLGKLAGKKASRKIRKGEPLSWQDVLN